MSNNENPYQSPRANTVDHKFDESEAIYTPMSIWAIVVVSLIFPGCPSGAMRAAKKRLPLLLLGCTLWLFAPFVIELDEGSGQLHIIQYIFLLVYGCTAISSVVLGLSDRNYLTRLKRSIVAKNESQSTKL